MSLPTEMNNPAEATSGAGATAHAMRSDMHWLLRHFVAEVAGVTHAVLLSRDGLRLLDSEVDKNWADELSAGLSGIDSIAKNLTGPSHKKRPAGQVIIEREDCLIFVLRAGSSTAFDNHTGSKVKDTILGVVATPDADVGAVGFEIGRLVQKFAPFMQVPVRERPDGER
ncbi:roadblock/LC7 domain-containing protein [Streptomyces sp. cg28]|uniref:roadblock/LC7 domain-containing protein n=1 Tax=Streptomyces sp. cg28 TaxID=3403457 RepID=UPI003B21CF5C